MGFEIPAINGFAIILYLASIAFSLNSYSKTKNYLWILVFGFSSIAILEAITNVFEWSDVLATLMDLLENFFLVLMYLIAIIFALGFKSLEKRSRKK